MQLYFHLLVLSALEGGGGGRQNHFYCLPKITQTSLTWLAKMLDPPMHFIQFIS